jgi:hypothetical protein
MNPLVCPTGKVTYSRDGARIWARKQRRAGHERMNAYGCAVCGGWHVGRSRARHWKPTRRDER